MDVTNIISCCVAVISMLASIYMFVITHKTPPTLRIEKINDVKYLIIKNNNNWTINKVKIRDGKTNAVFFQKEHLISTEEIKIDIYEDTSDFYIVSYFVYGIYFKHKIFLT